MAIVKMLGTYMSNVTGDVCGYPDDVAGALVKRGLAVYYAEQRMPAVEKAADAPAAAVAAPAAVEATPEPVAEPAAEPAPLAESATEPEHVPVYERRKRR